VPRDEAEQRSGSLYFDDLLYAKVKEFNPLERGIHSGADQVLLAVSYSAMIDHRSRVPNHLRVPENADGLSPTHPQLLDTTPS
jgi:hypothetical protein